jgi:uncharacterized protein with FMN-binding domain
MRRNITAAVSAVALVLPVGNAVAAANRSTTAKVTPKKKVVTLKKTVTGPQAQADRWGYVQVTLVVRKTTTTIGVKKTVTRKIMSVTVPVYPNHTDRSVFINQQALPMLEQEVLSAQFTGGVSMISGASNSSYAFIQSLQAAILQAQKV